MTLPALDSLVGNTFGLEIDGVMIKQITEVSGLKIEQDVIDYKANSDDGKYTVKRLPGRRKPPEITLTRGLTARQQLRAVDQGLAPRQDDATPARAARSSSSTSRARRSSGTC